MDDAPSPRTLRLQKRLGLANAVEKRAAATAAKSVPAKKKKEKKATKKASPSLSASRPRNFSPEEDIMLCKAYIAISTDSSVGNDQKADDFWKKVHQAFQLLCTENSDFEGPPRAWNSLQNRFQRHIQKEVQLYNCHYKKCKEENPSGSSEEDIITKAKTDYSDMEGKSFKFLHTVSILQKLPKFNPMIDADSLAGEEDEDKKMPATNVTTAPMGSSLERPIGCKKMKLLLAEKTGKKDNKNPLEASKVAAIEKTAAVSENIAEALAQKNELDMISMYHKLGEGTIALEMLNAMKKRKEEATNAKEEDSSPPSVDLANEDVASMTHDEAVEQMKGVTQNESDTESEIETESV